MTLHEDGCCVGGPTGRRQAVRGVVTVLLTTRRIVQQGRWHMVLVWLPAITTMAMPTLGVAVMRPRGCRFGVPMLRRGFLTRQLLLMLRACRGLPRLTAVQLLLGGRHRRCRGDGGLVGMRVDGGLARAAGCHASASWVEC